VQVRGPVVACMQESFAEDWFWAARTLPLLFLRMFTRTTACSPLPASGPADAYETCSLFFVEAIHAATERVWITSPLHSRRSRVRRLAPGGAARRRRAPAAAIAPRSPHRLRRVQPVCAFEAVRAGVRVFRYEPGFLHQKWC
jgi:cardiolipin synthase